MPKRKRPSKITGNAAERTVLVDGQPLDITPSLKLRRSSPTGFNWGYGGSGPAQLALAICLLFLSKPQALAAHQQFKWDIVAPLAPNFELDGDQLQHWFHNWSQHNLTSTAV